MIKDFEKDIVLQGQHYYSLITKKRLLSPTYLLRPLSLYTMESIPEHILAKARDRGKDIATAIEIFETHNEIMVEQENMPMFEAYKKWKKEYKVEILATEYHVVDHERSTHGYIDLMAMIDGKKVAIEIKTRNKFQVRDTDLIQNRIYKMAIPRTPFYLLQLSPAGNYKFEKMIFNKTIDMKIQTLKNFRSMLGKTKIKGDDKYERQN